jgi:hypothetical protein
MQVTLFKDVNSILHAQYSEFYRQVGLGQIEKVVLAGEKDKGFYICGRVKNSAQKIVCILVTQHSEIRYIKCPDNAHSFLYNMGIIEFDIDTTCWDMDSAFNPHKVSQESRLRKKRREDALIHRPLYLDKFRFAFNDTPIEQRIQLLVSTAVQKGWLEEPRSISKNRFFTWIDKRDLPDNKKVPAWAMKAAVVLSTERGIYPRNDLELSVFACLWYSINGPFESREEALDSLPPGFIDDVCNAGVTMAHIETAFNDEVMHGRYVQRRERQFNESREREGQD